jgi:RNA polymerase primary sigma factor
MFSEMGVNVVETEEASDDEEQREEAEEEAESEGGDLVEVQRAVPAKTEAKEPTERTDDPVRMYLREMGSVELLSREGEIAIAKRIEAGREAMIAGLCESPLSFQAIIIWRDELNEAKVFLRDIIDLEATYAGPDAKAMPTPPAIGPDGQPAAAAVPGPSMLMQTPAPPAAPAAATPFKAAPPERANGDDNEGAEPPPSEADFDDDDMENSLSLAAIEAELKPTQRFAVACPGASLQEAQGRDHRRGEVAASQSGAYRFAGRAALRHQQATGELRGPSDATGGEPYHLAGGLPQELSRLRT